MIFQAVLCWLIVSAYSSPLMTDGSGQSLASQAMVHGAVMAGMPVSANFVGWNTHDRAVAARPEGGNQGGGRENSGNGKGNGGGQGGRGGNQGQGREQ